MKKIIRTTKEKIKEIRKTIMTVAAAVLLAMQIVPMPVFASTPYIQPLENLKTIFITIIAAAGIIVLGYGVVKFATSFQKMDQNGEHQAVYTIIAGALMVGISAVMSALGV